MFPKWRKMQKMNYHQWIFSFHPKTGASIFNPFSHQKFCHPWLAPARSSDPKKEKARATLLIFCHLRLVPCPRAKNGERQVPSLFTTRRSIHLPKNSVISVLVLVRVRNQRQDLSDPISTSDMKYFGHLPEVQNPKK